MKHAHPITAGVLLLASSILGCESKIVIPEKPPVTGFVVPENRSAATAMLVTETAQFDSDISALPGESAEAHRQALHALLDDLSKILPLANGPVQSPEFTNFMSVINTAARTVDSPDLDRGRMGAAENQALLAAAAAVGEINWRYLYDDDQLPPLIDALNTKVSAAEKTIGPMHDLDATETFMALQAVVDRVSADMSERFLNQS